MLRNWWLKHRTKLLHFAIVLMTVVAVMRLGHEFWRLIFDSSSNGAVDLRILHNLTHEWFSGMPLASMFPPASWPLLWLFYGWLPLGPARWVWALTTIALLGGLAYLLVRASEAKICMERFFIVAFLLAIYPTAITIGNGQLTLHVILPLLAGILLMREKGGKWDMDLLASLLLLFSLIKPSISIPFFWLVFFTARSLRVLAVVSTGYAALTLVSISFRENALMGFFEDMKLHGSGVFTHKGYANLHIWLDALGLEAWIFPASFVVLVALGIWCYRYRNGDFWLQLGVTALVSRLWIYHRLYDDLLLIIPMIPLLRIAKQRLYSDGRDIKAGVLLILSWAALLSPGTLIRLPMPWSLPFRIGQTIIWILVLIFLLHQAWRDKHLKTN